MPEGCDVCPLMYDYIQCKALPEGCEDDDDFYKDEFDWTKRPDWCPLKEKLHKKHVITWGRNDEFSMRKLYETICETLLDGGELFIARTDYHEKVDFVFYVAEGR